MTEIHKSKPGGKRHGAGRKIDIPRRLVELDVALKLCVGLDHARRLLREGGSPEVFLGSKEVSRPVEMGNLEAKFGILPGSYAELSGNACALGIQIMIEPSTAFVYPNEPLDSSDNTRRDVLETVVGLDVRRQRQRAGKARPSGFGCPKSNTPEECSKERQRIVRQLASVSSMPTISWIA